LFQWIGDIIGGIGNFFGDSLDFFGGLITDAIWDVMFRWLYTMVFDAIAYVFYWIGNFGVEIFELPWVAAVLHFFYLCGWALFVVGMVVAVFDVAIESQSGRANIKGAFLNVLKGFFAVNLFTTLPVTLFRFAITLQNSLAGDLTRVFAGNQSTLRNILPNILLRFNPVGGVAINLFMLVSLIAIAYCVFRVFFDNLKRGGILIIQIAVGTLCMFSIPRGYTDGFTAWCKQIIALCLTSFLQMTLLFLGLLTIADGSAMNVGNLILGIGIMLAAAEVPRIAGQFGLDTSCKVNVMGAAGIANSAMMLTRNVARTAS
jgi:hypothetical protein